MDVVGLLPDLSKHSSRTLGAQVIVVVVVVDVGSGGDVVLIIAVIVLLFYFLLLFSHSSLQSCFPFEKCCLLQKSAVSHPDCHLLGVSLDETWQAF